jgi:3-oxoacyl-[acyl-carrier-protein] synthase II
MGEGAGVFVFESLEHAQKRGATILAEYMGGAVTCDAHHMTDPRSDGLGVSTCIELALKDAGIDKEQINYINAHATRWGRRLAAGVEAQLGAQQQWLLWTVTF